MGLYKRGSVWWMSFMDPNTGKQVRRSTETEDEERAKRIFDKIKGQIAEGKWFERLPGQDIKFRELMQHYLQNHSSRNKAASSHKRDKSIVKNLNAVFGDRYLTEIRSRDVAVYKGGRREEGASPRTVNYELTLMGHAFNLAIKEWEWVKENPVSRVSKERVHNQIERWLTGEEEKRLLQVSPKWLQDIIVFAINTGFRQSEILDLRWSQIDFERRTVTISEQKNRGVDTLPLNHTVMDLLKGRKAASGGVDHVFPNNNLERKKNRNLLKAFYTAIKKAKIVKFRFHDLRHTFATRLVQSGVDLYAVQKLGRWKNTSMVMRYAHHYPESLRPAIEVMDKGKVPDNTNLAQSPPKPQKRRGHAPYLRLVTP
jgi:integrase